MDAQSLSLNVFDIIVVIIVVIGMIRGYRRGLVTMIVGVIGLIAALILGYQFSYLFEDFFRNSFSIAPRYVTLLSGAAVFLIVLIIFTFVFKVIENILQQIGLGVNKALGALVGGYLAMLALSVLLMLLRPVNVPSPQSIADSVTYEYLRTFAVDNAKVALKILPVAKNSLRKLDQVVKDKTGAPIDPPEAPSQNPAKPTPVR